ncbi:MAG: DUF898 family protein [Pseudomonadota bacterium]
MIDRISGHFHSAGGPLFWLHMRTAFLTLFTLGIYRFWAKTRIRRYIWSATDAGGDAFEYTGTGLEKFLGFLVAIVILAIYLGIVQIGLAYFGIFVFAEPQTEAQMIMQVLGVYLSIFAVLPLIFFAQYRARRYRLSRTRWRGLRFGMDHAAWGYVLRALGHLLVTLLTLGLLLPRQTFYLEKFMTDRSWYGDAKFRQDGRWQALYPGMRHLFVGVGILIACVAGGAALGLPALAAAGSLIGTVWLLFGLLHYRVYSFNYLTRMKRLKDQIALDVTLTTGRVLGILVTGALAISGVVLMGAAMIGILFASLFGTSLFSTALDAQALEAQSPGTIMLASGLTVFLYVALIIVIGGVSLVMITQRIIAAAVNTITIDNASDLMLVRQREADRGADAEGFADALDLGGAI